MLLLVLLTGGAAGPRAAGGGMRLRGWGCMRLRVACRPQPSSLAAGAWLRASCTRRPAADRLVAFERQPFFLLRVCVPIYPPLHTTSWWRSWAAAHPSQSFPVPALDHQPRSFFSTAADNELEVELDEFAVSYKPQKISPKFPGTVCVVGLGGESVEGWVGCGC